MNRYRKGRQFEYDLIEMFLGENDWTAIRTPHSGSAKHPCPDILAGCARQKKVLALECKFIAKDPYYIGYDKVDDLKEFADKFGAEAWLAIKFNHVKPRFVEIGKLLRVGTTYRIAKEWLEKEGKTFDELVGKYEQKRLMADGEV